jgi:hypothetical protein
MMLGDLLARFADDASAAETLLGLGDLKLVAALRQRATAEGLGLGTLAALAVQRYADSASDEEWVTLIGELRRSADPGLAFIKRALRAA